jgi:preprotein translocase subunit YajC
VESLLFFALILVAFYFLIIRPQRARARQAAQLQAGLAPGVEVMTTAGMFGTVAELSDDALVLEVSPGVRVRFAKAAVGRIVSHDEDSHDEDSHDGDTDDTDDDTADDLGPDDTAQTDEAEPTGTEPTGTEQTDEAAGTDHSAGSGSARTSTGE